MVKSDSLVHMVSGVYARSMEESKGRTQRVCHTDNLIYCKHYWLLLLFEHVIYKPHIDKFTVAQIKEDNFLSTFKWCKNMRERNYKQIEV